MVMFNNDKNRNQWIKLRKIFVQRTIFKKLISIKLIQRCFFNNLNWDHPFHRVLSQSVQKRLKGLYIVLRVFFYIIYNFLAQNEHRNPVTSSVEKRNNSFSS